MDGVRTYFLYAGGQLLAELDESGTLKTTYTWGPTGLLNRTNLQTNSEVWYLFDPQGNAATRLDASGQVLSNDQYDAWGNLLSGGDPTDPSGYRAQFGYYTDHETGLILCGHRYYDPVAGRWLTRDPIGVAGGINLYAYCGGDAVGGVDPEGCDWLDKAANFSAGFGDSLTFGLTDLLREGIGVNDVVDHDSGFYRGGEMTEMGVEVVLMGGSGALKAAAKDVGRQSVRQAARTVTNALKKEILENGGKAIAHH